MGIHCIGCGKEIGWDGKSTFAYTCSCGATIFVSDEKDLSLPASLIVAFHDGKELAHLDYYIGISAYKSVEKEKIENELKRLGSIWSWNCVKCKDKIIVLIKERVKHKLYNFELHPELMKMLTET